MNIATGLFVAVVTVLYLMGRVSCVSEGSDGENAMQYAYANWDTCELLPTPSTD